MKYKHPVALFVLSMAELWERFGFYIVEGLLILYVTKALGATDSVGYTILGGFTALAYIMPILGGFIADQVLGFRHTIILGNLMLIAGYALLAISSSATILYTALALICVGTGFFKPNASSYLGTFYRPDDPLRDSGFTIYYMVFNFGILMATASAGFVQRAYGWHITFGMACVGMIIGLIIFVAGMRKIPEVHTLPAITTPLQKFLKHKIGMVIAIAVLFGFSLFLIRYGEAGNLFLWTASILLFVVLLYNSIKFTTVARNKFFALILLIISSIVFWAVYFQMFFSLNLFIDRLVNRQIFGFEIPTPMFIGLESFFIFALGPFLAMFWSYLNRNNKNFSIAFRFSLATFAVGLAFLWILLGIALAPGHLLNPIWIVLAYLFVTVGEMFLSPIGLAAVTVLAPLNWMGMMMGTWFIALSLGGKLAGIIATLSSIPANVTDPKIMMGYYQHAFFQYFLFAVIVGAIILIFTPALRLLEQGKTPSWQLLFKK